MNIDIVILKYLYNFYLNKQFSQGIHLDGGAALSFFYHIDRVFSGDLDFTIESQKHLDRFLLHPENPLGGNHSSKRIGEESICILKDNKKLFSIDYFLVSSKYCKYSRKKTFLEDSFAWCSIHSIEDIFVEKLFCLITRNKKQDVVDLIFILNQYVLDRKIVSNIFLLKNNIKKTQYSHINKFIEDFENIIYRKKDVKDLVQLQSGLNLFKS